MNQPLDYFYGQQANQFSFYRIPKILFSDERYAGLSPEAKILYGILLDRMELSARNHWLDEKGRVYIYFTIEEVMAHLGCGDKKAGALLAELEKKAGLIYRKRQGLGKPNLIYVKNFIPPDRQIQTRQNDVSGAVVSTIQDLSKSQGNNTDNNHTEFNDTDPSIPEGTEGSAETHSYASFLWDSLEMEILLQDSPADHDLLTELYGLICDTVISQRKTIRVAGDDKPMAVVRSQFLKLNRDHLQYVLESLKANTTRVRDMKQYLLAALYNAPFTLNSHYAAQVSHDFAAEGFSVSRREDPLPDWYRMHDNKPYDSP